MNEPNSMPTSQLVTSHNAAIAAIRDTGAKNLILVPGNQWTGAHAWNETYYNGPNSVHMLNIVDPIDNFAFDVHQYLDDNSSGTSDQIGTNANPDNPNIGIQRLTNFTNWLHANNRKGFPGRVRGRQYRRSAADVRLDDQSDGSTPTKSETRQRTCSTTSKRTTTSGSGWAWWAAGPWWGNYMFSLEPTNLGQPSQTDKSRHGRAAALFCRRSARRFQFRRHRRRRRLHRLARRLGQTGAGLDADTNIDGIVDELDYAVWKANFGESLAAAASASSIAVPEPGAMARSSSAAWHCGAVFAAAPLSRRRK